MMTALRSALFNIWLVLVTIGLATTGGMVARLLAPKLGLPVAQMWARMVLAGLRVLCRVQIRITGRDHLPTGPALIASQHQSAFDTMIWLVILQRPAYVAKQELIRIPLFGPLVAQSGMILVDRSGGPASMRRLVADTRAAITAGRQVVIFPEGTRTAPGEVVKLQPGIAAMAAATNLPVIPVATDSGHIWGRHAFAKHPGIITVAIQPPLPAGLPRPALLAGLRAAWQAGTGEPAAG